MSPLFLLPVLLGIIAACFALTAWLTRGGTPPPAGRIAALLVTSMVLAIAARDWGGDSADGDAFVLMKIAMIYVPTCLVFSRWIARRAPWILTIGAPLFVAANILMAVAFDAQNGRYVNAAAGCVLILTMSRAVDILPEWDAVGPFRLPLHWHVGGLWILAYTVWNAAFVIGFMPGFYIFGLTFHLALPLLLSRDRPERWLVFRALFLGVSLTAWDLGVMLVGTETSLAVFFDLRTPAALPVAHTVAVIALALAVATVVEVFARPRTRRPLLDMLRSKT